MYNVHHTGSKTFAERAAWDFIEKEKPNFDLVTLCPPLVFGPVIHSLKSLDGLNTSNKRIWSLMSGGSRKEVRSLVFGQLVDNLMTALIRPTRCSR